MIPSSSINFTTTSDYLRAIVKAFYTPYQTSAFAKVHFVVSDTLVPGGNRIVVSFNRSDHLDKFKTIDLDRSYARWFSKNVFKDDVNVPNISKGDPKQIISTFISSDFDSAKTISTISRYDNSFNLALESLIDYLTNPNKDSYLNLTSNFTTLEHLVSFIELLIDGRVSDKYRDKLALPIIQENLFRLSFLLLGVDNSVFPTCCTLLYL